MCVCVCVCSIILFRVSLSELCLVQHRLLCTKCMCTVCVCVYVCMYGSYMYLVTDTVVQQLVNTHTHTGLTSNRSSRKPQAKISWILTFPGIKARKGSTHKNTHTRMHAHAHTMIVFMSRELQCKAWQTSSVCARLYVPVLRGSRKKKNFLTAVHT